MATEERAPTADQDYDATDDPAHLLSNVYSALKHHASNDVFAIGGAIDLDPSEEPLTIRWESSKWRHGCKVSLPLKDDRASQHAFQQLLNDCQLATFGRGKEEVLDTEYRKAGKMDVSNFCTNFDLAAYHIMYTLTQALVQSMHLDKKNEVLNGVIARLYSLNVCSNQYSKYVAAYQSARYTRSLQESSRHMSILPAQRAKWDLLSSAFLTHTKVSDLTYYTMEVVEICNRRRVGCSSLWQRGHL